MQHSNNAARIRIWLALKGTMGNIIETRMVGYAELQTDAFISINPLKKVPAFIRDDGRSVWEAVVILDYLEDKYRDEGPSFKPSTAEGRQLMNLMIRTHDLYIASPNCTQPGFTHTQGAMYLTPYETEFCAAVRCIARPARAAKIAELWKHLSWLNSSIVSTAGLADTKLSLADFTWYPTCTFIEYMTPRVFGWDDIFDEATGALPALASWYTEMTKIPAFASARQQIWEYWVQQDEKGQFDSIRPETEDTSFKWKYP